MTPQPRSRLQAALATAFKLTASAFTSTRTVGASFGLSTKRIRPRPPEREDALADALGGESGEVERLIRRAVTSAGSEQVLRVADVAQRRSAAETKAAASGLSVREVGLAMRSRAQRSRRSPGLAQVRTHRSPMLGGFSRARGPATPTGPHERRGPS